MENTVIPNSSPKEIKDAEFMWESVALSVLGPRWDHPYKLQITLKIVALSRGLLIKAANVIKGSLEKKKRQARFMKGIFLLQDNAAAHALLKAMTTAKECGYEILSHPTYSFHKKKHKRQKIWMI